MKDILLQLAHLEGSPVYGMLLKAESYESAYLQGMLTVYELDAMIFLRPCAELWSMEEERESASLLAGHVRDFCLMVDGMYQVDRSMWLILGTMLYKNPFSIFEDYLVSVLREDHGRWCRVGCCESVARRGLYQRISSNPLSRAISC